MRRLVWLTIFLLTAAGFPALASEKDHDAVLRAVRAGEIKALTEIMDLARPHLQGEVIKVEAEREDGVWVYEFRIVSPNGQRSDVYIDARTGNLIRVKRK